MEAQGVVEAEAGDSVAHCDGTTVLAPLFEEGNFPQVGMKSSQLEPGPVDFVIRCARGLFSGRFIYVNKTEQGELFGSDKTAADITMYIENASLSAKHAEIRFNEQTYQYFLRDYGSDLGTWTKIRWNRSIEVSAGQELQVGELRLRFEEGPEVEPAAELREWLLHSGLDHLTPAFQRHFGTQGTAALRLSDLAAQLRPELPSGLADLLSTTETALLQQSVDELERMFPLPRARSLVLVREDTGETVATFSWAGGSVRVNRQDADILATSPGTSAKERVLGTLVMEEPEWLSECLRVGFSHGRYYVHCGEESIVNTTRGQHAWVRLRPKQQHWLQPDDMFRIGDLDFVVMRFNSGQASQQGVRVSMEDEEIVLQDLAASNWRHCSFFGVYDGHGGRACAEHVRRHLHMNFIHALHAQGGLDRSRSVHKDICEALTQAYLRTDDDFLGAMDVSNSAGCATVTVTVVGAYVYCANCGDARAILCRNGRPLALSDDHKPDRADEVKRIEAAGGFVSFRRVLGRLAVSRAFGDKEYKSGAQQLVIANPEIRVERLTAADEFLVLACDGLFDVYSNQEVCDYIRNGLKNMSANEQDPQRIVDSLVADAIRVRRSRDNVTAVLVTFKRAIF